MSAVSDNMNKQTMQHTIVLLPGDGIGPEVTKATCRVLDAAGFNVDWITCDAGAGALEKGHNDVLPDETVALIRQHKVALKGPITTPVGKGFTSVNVRLRKALDLYAAVRPVRSMPGIKTKFTDPGVDLVIVRENTEGLYSGIENEVVPGVVTSLKVASEGACRRISKFAFNYAEERGRKNITVFHKANIMKMSDGLFIRCAQEEAEKHPSIRYDERIIDAACMKMVQDPSQFDVLLLENLYGDVVSDLCAGLVGGLGVVPGSNIGNECAVFEAVHGSAPDIAGKGLANPLALLMSAVMMLNHIGETEIASRVKTGYDAVLKEGATRTRDLGGTASTEAFADALIAHL